MEQLANRNPSHQEFSEERLRTAYANRRSARTIINMVQYRQNLLPRMERREVVEVVIRVLNEDVQRAEILVDNKPRLTSGA